MIFTCNHCPTAQAYEERIIRLHAETRDKGVAVVAISPNDPAALRLDELGYTDVSDSFEDMKIRAKDRKFAFPYLYDGDTQATAKAYGVLATPHVYIFDAGAEAPLCRPVRRLGGEDGQVARRPQRRRCAAGGQAGPGGEDARLRLLDEVGRQAASAEKSLAKLDAEPVTLETIDDAGVAKLAKNDTKKLLLVNLWATWCGPCVAELPDFVTMNRMYRKRNFELVTISLDEPEKKDDALKVLKENHLAATNYILKTDDRDTFADALDKEWPGPVPYTLADRPRRQGHLSQQDRRDRSPRGEAGDREFPRANVLIDELRGGACLNWRSRDGRQGG